MYVFIQKPIIRSAKFHHIVRAKIWYECLYSKFLYFPIHLPFRTYCAALSDQDLHKAPSYKQHIFFFISYSIWSQEKCFNLEITKLFDLGKVRCFSFTGVRRRKWTGKSGEIFLNYEFCGRYPSSLT